MRTHEVDVRATVTIRIADEAPEDVLTRVTDPDFPYRLPSVEAGLEHLAYNAVRNGVMDASQLDGWGDLERGVLWLDVDDVDATS